MKILFVAPLPPPINGHSLAAKVLLDGLAKGGHEVVVVDLSVGSRGDGSVTFERIAQVVRVLRRVWQYRRVVDVIYFTISESLAGNLKDLLIYTLCVSSLPRMFIHLHGGTLKVELFDRYRWLRSLNAWFVRRLAGVIISGRSHEVIFDRLIDSRRVHIVENFAQEELFVGEQQIREKFSALKPIRVLFISNMIPMKGFGELTDAYTELDAVTRECICIDFAGRFDFDSNRREFEQRIAGVAGLRYHGVVDDEKKRRLFAHAHVFCLPTAFREGQPISLLEAYAAGCVVLTTGQSGIRDVFTHGVNGFEIQTTSRSIAAALTRLVADPRCLLGIAVENRRLASSRFRAAGYNMRLRRILESAGSRTIPKVAVS